MKYYKDIDINDALDKVADITKCEIKYVNCGETLYYTGLCVDRDDTFNFFLNMTIQNRNRECKEEVVKVIEKEQTKTRLFTAPYNYIYT